MLTLFPDQGKCHNNPPRTASKGKMPVKNVDCLHSLSLKFLSYYCEHVAEGQVL